MFHIFPGEINKWKENYFKNVDAFQQYIELEEINQGELSS